MSDYILREGDFGEFFEVPFLQLVLDCVKASHPVFGLQRFESDSYGSLCDARLAIGSRTRATCEQYRQQQGHSVWKDIQKFHGVTSLLDAVP